MASIKDLKKRIGSVKNTQQTTKAMKMVSAAKLRRAQDAIINNRPYAKAVGSLIAQMLNQPEANFRSPLLDRENVEVLDGSKKVLVLVVTSDRGLCAGFNSNLIRATQRWVRENQSKYASITLAYLGKRGYDFFKTKNYEQGAYFSEAGGKVTFQKAKEVSQRIVQSYLDGQFDEVKVVFNEFKNAASQVITFEDFLPLRPKAQSTATAEDSSGMVLIKPTPNEVLRSLLDKHFNIQVFRMMLDSQAGEHGARMSAMENATKNAGEMIKKLTLVYNKQRQAGITKELLEIISGSESQKQ